MADNLAITPGTGATTATNDIGGVHHQRVKLGLGAAGTANDAVAGAGVVGVGVQRVTLASDDPAVAALTAGVPAIGTVVSGAADSGNPVKVGGVFNTTAPTLDSGDRGDIQLDSRANLKVSLQGTTGGNPAYPTAGADAVSNTTIGLQVYNRPSFFNGTTWDRQQQVGNGLNSTGAGIAAAGLVAQLDDTSPSAVTENQFGNVRMSASRAVHVELRSGAAAADIATAALQTAGNASLATIEAAIGDPGQATPANSVPVIEAKLAYETVAASQTDQMLGATGAAGDYLSHLLVIPATTSPGAISIEDGSTNITVFAGGATSVGDLKPFPIPLGIASTTGGWEITTGANVSVIAAGVFT
jgi:hypothetical protein